jgi:hypothetical protein
MTSIERQSHCTKTACTTGTCTTGTNTSDVALDSSNMKRSDKRKRKPSEDQPTADIQSPTKVAKSKQCTGDAPTSSSPEVILMDNKIETELPDVNEDISPDDFLLKLVSAQYNVSLQPKPALSLKNFFSPVSEEQMEAYTIQIVTTARNNDLDGLKKLHSEGQRLDCSNRFGESLLNMACRRGFEDIVEYFLEQPDFSVRISDDGGRTPLHDTCWNPTPQLAICKWLIEREPSLFLILDKRGCTAFQYARPQHWLIWRTFLLENREHLKGLTEPEILNLLTK